MVWKLIMKLLITTLTMIFISFGASANSAYFKYETIPFKECLRVIEKGKYVGKPEINYGKMYILDGYIYIIKAYPDLGPDPKKKGYQTDVFTIDHCSRSDRFY